MPNESTTLIYEHLPFERRWMTFQRIAWLCLSLVLLGSVFGVFGRGAYARQTEVSGPLRITYDRIVRSRTQVDLDIVLAPEATHSGQARLVLSGALLRGARLFDVLPKPSSEETFEGGTILTFQTVRGRPARVLLTQKIDGLGFMESNISLDGSAPVTLKQFTLP